MTTYVGHQADFIENADLIIYSSAVPPMNPEMQAAKSQQIPCIQRGRMLAELMVGHHGVAVAGTHGKTTVTALLSTILIEANLDPSYVIGAALRKQKRRAQQGKGNCFIAEADESDASFLYFRPNIVVVNNIEPDHMKTYGNDEAELKKAFTQFVNQMPDDGLAVACIDDKLVRLIHNDFQKPVCYFGFSQDADVYATNYTAKGLQCQFTVHGYEKVFDVTLNMPGKHNVLNALAAITVALSMDVPVETISTALESFQGVERRFGFIKNINVAGKSVDLIDDYGHHPSEIDATMVAIRDAYPNRRIVLAYQPHRYTRTRDCFSALVESLSASDFLLLVDIYSAGEAPIEGVTGEYLFNDICKKQPHSVFVPSPGELIEYLSMHLQEDDVLIIQGAGDISDVAELIREASNA